MIKLLGLLIGLIKNNYIKRFLLGILSKYKYYVLGCLGCGTLLIFLLFIGVISLFSNIFQSIGGFPGITTIIEQITSYIQVYLQEYARIIEWLQ